jgi:pantoate--beta-alanine ligase
MSSRNVYLTQEQRQVAPRLFAHLDAASAALAYGAASELVCEASRVALVASGFEVNYFVVVEPSSLEPVTTLAGPVRLIAAARLGTVRLLDNVAVVAMV